MTNAQKTAGSLAALVVGSVVSYQFIFNAPTPGNDCDWPNFPDATCTGYEHTGVTLTAYTGANPVTTNGTTIDSKLISGTLFIRADNVTVMRSKIDGGGVDVGFPVDGVDGTVLTDVEIDCGPSVGAAMGNQDITGLRLNVYGCSQGFQLQDSDIRDSYFHDLYGDDVSHGESGIIKYCTDCTYIHNRFDANIADVGDWDDSPTGCPAQGCGISAAIAMYTHPSTWTAQSGIHFEKNFLNVGDGANDHRDFGALCLYAGTASGEDITNSDLFDNVFDRNPSSEADPDQCGFAGTVENKFGSGVCWDNNRFETGELIGASGSYTTDCSSLGRLRDYFELFRQRPLHALMSFVTLHRERAAKRI